MSAPYLVTTTRRTPSLNAGWNMAQFCLEEANREHALRERADRFMLVVTPLLMVAVLLGGYIGYLIGLRRH